MAPRERKTPQFEIEGEISNKIQGMFYRLQTNTEKFLEELDRSYELYKVGEKTDFTQKLEKWTSGNAGKLETELVGQFLTTLKDLGKNVVVDGFIKRLKHVDKAYLLSEDENRVLYGLVPEEGQEKEVREKVAEFYATTSTWEMFKYNEPFFQVIPSHLMPKVNYSVLIK